MPNYTGAFQCGNCPENNDPTKGRACPWWWEVIYKNHLLGEEKILKSCGITQLPVFLTEFTKTNVCAAAAVEDVRNHIAKGFGHVVATMQEVLDGNDASQHRLAAPRREVRDGPGRIGHLSIERDAGPPDGPVGDSGRD